MAYTKTFAKVEEGRLKKKNIYMYIEFAVAVDCMKMIVAVI